MPASIACPFCGQSLKASADLAGRRIRCPKCGNAWTVQAPDVPPPPAVRPDLPAASPPHAAPAPPVTAKKSVSAPLVLGVVALVLGAGGCVVSWAPWVGLLATPCSGVGLLLGLTGVVLVWHRRQRGLATPLAGALLCLLALLLAVGISVVTTVLVRNKIQADAAAEEARGLDPPENDIHVTAAQLWSEEVADQVTADSRYLGRTLQVSGLIDTIGTDIGSQQYLTFKPRSGINPICIQCYFGSKHAAELDSLKVGDTVTVRGRFRGFAGNYQLLNCMLAPQGDQPK